MPTVKIDGVEVEVPEGTNMIEAAQQVGVEIPHYCYHPHLSIAGNCRMCLVDIEAGGRGPDIACNMVARDGLEIRTDTPAVVQMRKSVMEFLLVNHPLDCPICDQAGECRLQDYYMDYGGYESRLVDPKVSKAKRQDIGTELVLDSERCVQCSRCVRFGDEVTGTGDLRLFNRTNHTEIGVFPGEHIDHNYQGCLADICPVGALTSKEFRFVKRVWYLKEAPSVCTGCATGCNVQICHETNEVFRVLPRRNDEVNKSWMCDPGRAHTRDQQSTNRLYQAQFRGQSVDLETAIQSAATGIKQVAEQRGASAVGIVLGNQASLESNWVLSQVAKTNLQEAPVLSCAGNDPGAIEGTDNLLLVEDKNPNTAGVATMEPTDLASNKEGLAALVVLEDDVVGRLGELAVDLLVYIGSQNNATAKAAHVVLPCSSSLEQEGCFVNNTGRVQRSRRALHPLGDSRPGPELIDALGTALGTATGLDTAAKAFDHLAGQLPGFSGMSHKSLGETGQSLASGPSTDTSEPAAPEASP